MKKSFALLLAALMAFGLMGCNNNFETVSESGTDTESASSDTKIAVTADTPISVGVTELKSSADPLMTVESDDNLTELTQLKLFTRTRLGRVVLDGIKGETEQYGGRIYSYYGPAEAVIESGPDDGGSIVCITLRQDLKFSDGRPLDIDDVIFSLYVFADPTYTGKSLLGQMPIHGMKEYRAGADTLYHLLISAGRSNTEFRYWDENTQNAFWAQIDAAGEAYAKQIADYCIKNYSEYAEIYTGVSADKVRTDEALKIKLGMYLWGYEDYWKEGAAASDFFAAMYNEHGGDLELLDELEGQDGIDSIFTLMPDYKRYNMTVLTDGVSSVSGIERVSDYGLSVYVDGELETVLEQLCLPILSLDHYGDRSLYKPEENSFGFVKGEIDRLFGSTKKPLGAGAYKLDLLEDGAAELSANSSYYMGSPAIGKLTLKAYDNDKALMSALKAGEIFIARTECTAETMRDNDCAIEVCYPSGKYGCIGISADRVRAGDKGSEQSKKLRKAFAAVFAELRQDAVDAFYADRARLIEYPMSLATYGSPQEGEKGYRNAFAFKTTDSDRTQGLLDMLLRYFEEAGYTSENGRLMSAPEGSSLCFTAYVCAGGSGGHPVYKIFTEAAQLLEQIGVTLEVRDIENSAELWNALYEGTADIWAEDWDAAEDPGLRQLFYGDAAGGGANAGSASYLYRLADADIDAALVSLDKLQGEEYRSAVRSVMEAVLDWAVKLPVYERYGAVLFSADHIAGEIPTLSLHHDWTSEVCNITLK